jgi:hypothetical protein
MLCCYHVFMITLTIISTVSDYNNTHLFQQQQERKEEQRHHNSISSSREQDSFYMLAHHLSDRITETNEMIRSTQHAIADLRKDFR